MEILLVLVIFFLIFIFMALDREWRIITQFIDGPNGQKYKVEYSVRLPRYKYWISNVSIIKNNF